VKCVLVVPCFNEASRWTPEYWARALSLPGVRWIFVDDGSSDDTFSRIDEISTAGLAESLRLPSNAGKAEAVRLGLNLALSRHPDSFAVGFMDADGAIDPSDILRLISSLEEHSSQAGSIDAVWAARVGLSGRDVQRSLTRHYIGRAVATFLALGQPNTPYDTQCGLKLFLSSDQFRKCLETPFQTRWLFEIELMNRWLDITGDSMRIWEEPLRSWHAVGGSKITFREVVRIVHELYIVKRLQRRSRRSDSRESDLAPGYPDGP
jgi:glycosyltransferase involved in cell wall biosynthesis